MFHDQAKIYVEAGRGGNGCVSFRREAHVPRGGPDGGDGGRGGDVVLVCDPSRRDLAAVRRAPHFRAGRGAHGQGARKQGARGDDTEILVPPGTQAESVGGEYFDLTVPGQRAIVASGGLGGHGNKRFASSTRQAPRFAERGISGESGWIELRLKLLADAGFVGLPNAGKSSLLARMTRAAPKVADYPFTTLEPVLGTLESGDRQLVLADIPGLIEGAAEGVGLGHEFLAHVERCRLLLHVVAVDAEDPLADYRTVRAELEEYGHGLAELPEVLVLSKVDLLDGEGLRRRVGEVEGQIDSSSLGLATTSSATGTGLDELASMIVRAVPEEPAPAATGIAAGEFEAEHRVYRPEGEGGFTVVAEEDGAFRVQGRGIELLFERHDLGNPEALGYLEQRLVEIGVIAALRRAGFESGDEVRIGEHELELDSGL